MAEPFPVYDYHADVLCFNCRKKMIGQPVPSGVGDALHNPPGHGRFRQWCEPCKMFTWYDLTDPKPWLYRPNLLK